jgi:hypothetical protein
MYRGVVLRATKGAGSAKGRESMMSGEMFLEVVSKMVEVLLTHDLCMYDSGGHSRKVHPSNIARKEFDLGEHLRCSHRSACCKSKFRKKKGSLGHNLGSGREFTISPRVVSWNRTGKERHVIRRGVRAFAERLARASS